MDAASATKEGCQSGPIVGSHGDIAEKPWRVIAELWIRVRMQQASTRGGQNEAAKGRLGWITLEIDVNYTR